MLGELVAGQHLLADRVAEVVSQDVRGLDTKLREQCLVHVGVVSDGVLIGDGLVGEPHPEHVGGDHSEPFGQRCPISVPSPTS